MINNITYARLKKNKGISFRTLGYNFQKGIWIQVEDKDVMHLLENCNDRIEFAPKGTVPKNEAPKTIDGVITVEGKGKDAIVKSKNEVADEFSEEEEAEILRVKEKFKNKREKTKKEAEGKKVLEAKEKKEKEKLDKKTKKKDITDANYIKDKYKGKQE